jgi:hypothetical protein
MICVEIIMIESFFIHCIQINSEYIYSDFINKFTNLYLL